VVPAEVMVMVVEVGQEAMLVLLEHIATKVATTVVVPVAVLLLQSILVTD
jgi:hypothetical protein